MGDGHSPTELQLLSHNNQLKQRIKEMEELYTAEDEKSYQEIQRLLQEQKDLKAKVENLQTRLYNAENISPPSSPIRSSGTSSRCLPSPLPTKCECDTFIDDASFKSHHSNADKSSFLINPDVHASLVEDYASLQDNFKTLSDEKAEAVAEVNKLTEQIKTLQEIIEDLRHKENVREETIQKMENAYNELCQNNQDLYKTVGQLHKEIEDLQSCNRFNESPMSLFDELEVFRCKEGEEFQSTEEEQDEVFIKNEEVVVCTEVMEINNESHEHSLPEILENSFHSKAAIEERQKLFSNDHAVNKSCTSWISQSLAIFVLTMLFIIIYGTVCVQLDKPVFWFVSSQYFNTRLVTVKMPPM